MEFNESILIKRSDDVKLPTADRRWMTLHCQQCNTILADSFGICGEVRCMDSVLCQRVTDDVVVSDAMETGYKGEMASCIYSGLKCRGCRCAVGKVLHSSPSRLAAIRSMFLLSKANICCYVLNSRSVVKASALSFDQKPLRESFDETRQQFEAQLDWISRLKSILADRSISRKLDK